MQLNPARGRKLVVDGEEVLNGIRVYAAQPREGTETFEFLKVSFRPSRGVYAAQPREGTETKYGWIFDSGW